MHSCGSPKAELVLGKSLRVTKSKASKYETGRELH